VSVAEKRVVMLYERKDLSTKVGLPATLFVSGRPSVEVTRSVLLEVSGYENERMFQVPPLGTFWRTNQRRQLPGRSAIQSPFYLSNTVVRVSNSGRSSPVAVSNRSPLEFIGLPHPNRLPYEFNVLNTLGEPFLA